MSGPFRPLPPQPGLRGPDAPLPLRPLSIGDLIDAAFKLFRRNVQPLVIITALVAVPTQLLLAFVQRDLLGLGLFGGLGVEPDELPDLSGMLAEIAVAVPLTLVVIGVAQPLVTAAAVQIVSLSYLGQDEGWSDAARVALRRGWAVIGATWLAGLVILLPLVPSAALFAAGLALDANPALLGLGLLTLLPGLLAVFLLTPLFAAQLPALVIEGVGPVQSIRRSWGLVRRRYLGVLGAVVVMGILAGLAGALVGALPSGIGQAVGGPYAWVLVAVGGIASALVQQPLNAITSTLIYYDARIRHEGFDVQILAAELGREPPPQWGPAAGWDPAPPGPPGYGPGQAWPDYGAHDRGRVDVPQPWRPPPPPPPPLPPPPA